MKRLLQRISRERNDRVIGCRDSLWRHVNQREFVRSVADDVAVEVMAFAAS
jgi:hypothetical protein